MPWHGKSVAGDLSTPVGTKSINGEGGCVVVRHPQAPGVTRNTAQQARDTAQGHEWRNYALLCGDSRYLNGGPALGANAWLYCDPNGRTWRMTVERNYSTGNSISLQVWRRELFGVTREGPAYTITDERVGNKGIVFQIPPEYSGGQSASDCAANSNFNFAAAIVPNPAGNSVYVHVCCTNDVYLATQVNIGGQSREVYAIVEIALSGSGDVENNGVGISATFPSTDEYTTLRTENDGDTQFGSSLPADWYDCAQTDFFDPPTPDPPTSAGLTFETTEGYTPDNLGSVHEWQTGPAEFREATVYRTHLGDVVIQRHDYTLNYRRWEINSGLWERTQHLVSVANPDYPGPGEDEFIWQFSHYTYTQTGWNSSISGVSTGVGRIESSERRRFAFGALSYDLFWLWREEYDVAYTDWQETGGCDCTNPGAWPPDTHPADQNFPEFWDSSLGTLSGGMTSGNIDLRGGSVIHPGMIVFSWNYRNLNNDGNRTYEYRFVGIGENNIVEWDTYAFQNPVFPPPINLTPTKWSFQPVTEEGDYQLGSSDQVIQYC